MKAMGFVAVGALATAVGAMALVAPAQKVTEGFTLADVVPNDVFLFVAERHNPERAFIDEYWDDVLNALAETGIGDDVMELIGSFLDAEQQAEVDRLKRRTTELLAAVDWDDLDAKEMVFAERLGPPTIIGERGMVMMPDMVWLFRGSVEGAARNFEGLAAILDGFAEELNQAVGVEALSVKRGSRLDGKVPTASLVPAIPNVTIMSITVAAHNDLVIIVMGERLLPEVLDLLGGSSAGTPLADSPRFKAAFAQLPAAEDSMEFFDMQALLEPIPNAVKTLTGLIAAPEDEYVRAKMSAEADKLHDAALSAYQRGDMKEALKLVEQAYDADPKSSMILYNLACFNAMLGNKDSALDWLEEAVEGGFYAPSKISGDSDLDSLRGEARYAEALENAKELAAGAGAKDIVENSTRSGEAYRLSMQAWKVYKNDDYQQGLKLVEQAHAVAPTDSRVLYYLACFHTLLGHNGKGLDFLEQAVEGGFYSPRHIAKDPDLKPLHDQKRYQAALAKAKKYAAKRRGGRDAGKLKLVQKLVDRAMDAAGIIDYTATVGTTDGFDAHTESIAVLVPDAAERAIYPVFGKQAQLTNFDRYLPQETVSFSISNGVSLVELYNFILDTIGMAGDDGEEVLAKWSQFQTQFGVDVQEDVLGWIEGTSVSVTLAADQGSVLLLKVTDEQSARDAVGAAIAFVSTQLGEAASENPAMMGLAMLAIRTSPCPHEQLEGFENLQVGMMPQPAVWGVADGHLIFGSSADAVALCLATAKGEHPNIRENEQAMSEAIVPPGPFSAITLTDERNFGADLAAGLGIASMAGSMVGPFLPDPQASSIISRIGGMLGKLAPAAQRIDFYKSTATHTTFDGQKWHTHTTTHYVSPEERAGSNSEPAADVPPSI
ncbi:MAG: hypothetical protein GY842_08840 [bacterium]|nr:hypothetical protein [bacterium]